MSCRNVSSSHQADQPAVVQFGAAAQVELVALAVADVQISARKGRLVVRYGKGGRYREVPLRPELRTAIEEWLKERAAKLALVIRRCFSTTAATGFPPAAPQPSPRRPSTSAATPSSPGVTLRPAATRNIAAARAAGVAPAAPAYWRFDSRRLSVPGLVVICADSARLNE